jgi:glycosyltransferase involved in cell wall biosynthesis
VEKYLECCLESIKNQTYTNFEVIMVNDGSTDSSGKICKKYSDIDSRFKLINQQNFGLSTARNNGIKKAVAELLTFVDSDDWVEDDFLMSLYTDMYTNRSDISMCNFMIDDKHVEFAWTDKVYSGKTDILKAYSNSRNVQIVNRVMNKLYKKSVVDKLFFPEGKVYEDIYWTPLVLERCCRLSRISNPLYHYRLRENSLTHIKPTKKMFADECLNRIFKNDVLLRNARESKDSEFIFKAVENLGKDMERIFLSWSDLENRNVYGKLKETIYKYDDLIDQYTLLEPRQKAPFELVKIEDNGRSAQQKYLRCYLKSDAGIKDKIIQFLRACKHQVIR